jgi:transposase-like protein
MLLEHDILLTVIINIGGIAMPKRKLVTANKFCDNKQCKDYGRTDRENIKGSGHSPNGTQRYICKTCKVTFTETKGTLFYGRRTPNKDILEALAMLAERMSIAAVARVKGVKEETVSDWLKDAASHIQEIEEALLKDYHVDKAQMDSLWTYVGNKGKKGAMKNNQIKVASGVEH